MLITYLNRPLFSLFCFFSQLFHTFVDDNNNYIAAKLLFENQLNRGSKNVLTIIVAHDLL